MSATAVSTASPPPVEPSTLVEEEGRLGHTRNRCPREGCNWWVPDGFEYLAESHDCPVGRVYDVDREGLLDAEGLSAAEYVAEFVEDGRFTLDSFRALRDDLAPRPPSERIRLLFDWELFGYQRAIADDPSPDVSVNGGRQYGKTETGGAVGADRFLWECIPADADVGFYGDVKDTAVEMFRRCKDHFQRSPLTPEQLGIETTNQTYWEAVTGERILTGTLKNGGDTERGKLPRVAIVDEAALVEASAFEDVIEPMFATHGDDHEMIIFSTPRGESGYHYRANSPDLQPDYFSAHSVPTWANPLVDDDFLERKRRSTDSLSWQQEWLGEFVEEGNAWIPSSIYRPCRAENTVEHPDPALSYFMGVDVARKGDDRTVFLIMASNGEVPSNGIISEQTSTMPGVLGRMKALHAEWSFERVLVDEGTFGGGVVDFSEEAPELKRVVDGFTFSTPKKSSLYQNLKKSFEEEDLRLPPHTRLMRETTGLRFDFTSNGHLRVSHPEGGHDDHPDALALADYARAGVGKKNVRRRRPGKA